MSDSDWDDKERVTSLPASQKSHYKRRRKEGSPTQDASNNNGQRGGTDPWSTRDRHGEGTAASPAEDANMAGPHQDPQHALHPGLKAEALQNENMGR